MAAAAGLGAALGAMGSIKAANQSKRNARAVQNRINEASRKLSTKEVQGALKDFFPGFIGEEYSQVGPELISNILGLVSNPGQLSTVAYERGQEQAEMLRRGISAQFGNEFGRSGISAKSGVSDLVQLAALLNAANRRNENLRDFTQLEEGFRRQDISMGQQLFQSILNQVFGMQEARANTELGAANLSSQNPVPDPTAAFLQRLGMAGMLYGATGSKGSGSSAAPDYSGRYGTM